VRLACGHGRHAAAQAHGPDARELLAQWEAACATGGLGELDPNAVGSWRRIRATALYLSQATCEAMAPICEAAGGTPFGGWVSPDSIIEIRCDFV
jgi:hypothetical protein